MIPLIIGITFLSFLVMSLVPGDFLSSLKLNPSISPQRDPPDGGASSASISRCCVRYVKWLWAALHLDLGISLAYRVSVVHLIGARALNTVILAVSSMLFSWMLAIPIGIVVAVKQNSIWDRVLSFLAFFGMSLPNFFLAFLLMYFALRTGWFSGRRHGSRSTTRSSIRGARSPTASTI